MIVEIEEAVIARLKDKGLNVGDLTVKEGTKREKLPAVFVSTEAGDFEKEAMKYKCEVTILVAVVFKHLQSDRKQRHGMYPILESVISFLTLQKLDLEIRALKPVRFRNITDKDMVDDGLIAFQIEFKTSFTLSKLEEDEAFDLLKIALSYYLQDPADDGVADAEDVVTL